MGSIVKEVDDVRQVSLMKRTALFLLDNSTTVVFIVMLIAAGFFSDRFYSGDNITNVLRQSVPLGLAALGMLFVILTGGIDLSIGSIMAFVSVLVGLLIPEFGLWPALIAGVGIATLMGGILRFLVTWFNIAPFIATLAMMTIARGVALIISKGQPVFIDNDAFVNFGTGYFLGIPLPVYVFLGFAIICQLVYKIRSLVGWWCR